MKKVFAGLLFILFNITMNVNLLGLVFSMETMMIGYIFTAAGFKELVDRGSFASVMIKFSWTMFLILLIRFLVSFMEIAEGLGAFLSVLSVAGTVIFFIVLVWSRQKAQIGIKDSDEYKKVKIFWNYTLCKNSHGDMFYHIFQKSVSQCARRLSYVKYSNDVCIAAK